MEIGKKVLSDTEFANLWGILYQEFYKLSITNSCDATLVYNSIYIICTSGSSLEEKLYWKIGDFFFNRCKIHKDQIIASENYIAEYMIRFVEYRRLVDSIHSLGSFLNDCVKGRALNDFGYLLWERMVIQNLKKQFFSDVLEYQGDVAIFLDSLEKIVPDHSQKLLYYKEKYEKVAFQMIQSKYTSIQVSSILDFCQIIRQVVANEISFMKKYLLPYSYDSLMSVLEECLLSPRYYELIINIRDFLYYTNIENRAEIPYTLRLVNPPYKNTCADTNATAINVCGCVVDDCFDVQKLDQADASQSFIKEDVDNRKHKNMKEVDFYRIFDAREAESIKSYVEKEFKTSIPLSKIHNLIEKSLSSNTPLVNNNLLNQDFAILLETIGTLNEGFILLKKAYALYIEMVLKSNSSILSGTVKNIYLLVKYLDIFENADAKLILQSIVKQYLQRSKPCFMKRLCEFIQQLVLVNSTASVPKMKPFDHNQNSQIFQTVIDLISDKAELMNIYQAAMKDRLINGRSSLIWEYTILEFMAVPKDDKLYKMLQEIEATNGGLKILNSAYWNIEPESSYLKLPDALLIELKKSVSGLDIINEKDKFENTAVTPSSEAGSKELGRLSFRLKCNSSSDKIINIAHQYSKIKLNINNKSITVNAYQYAVIDILSRSPETFMKLSMMLKISDQLLESVIESLLRSNIVSCVRGLCILNCKDLVDVDISILDKQEKKNVDVCIDSYLQALGVKVLKNRKSLDLSSLVAEIQGLSQLDIEENAILESLKKLVEKGMAETQSNMIEYVH
ncbi:hypothetical protein GINT2_001982 [Glugoides intestinalis]